MKSGGFSARTTDRTMKKATKTFMTRSWVFSDIFSQKVFLKKSSVSVELEVRTRLASVDMEAESTSTMMIPIRISGMVDSMVGTMLSKAMVPSGWWMAGTS